MDVGIGGSLDLTKGNDYAVVPHFYIILGDMMPMR